MPTITETRIIGTTTLVFAAWEPLERTDAGYSHGTSRTIDGERFGRIGTRALPEDLNALRGEERIRRVGAWQESQYQEAYTAIFAARTELRRADLRADMGEIEIQVDESA